MELQKVQLLIFLPRYGIVGVHAYPIDAGDSKRYHYNIERGVCKLAIVSSDIDQWYFRLLPGKGLARTIAILVIGFVLTCYRITQHPDHRIFESEKDAFREP